MKSNFRKLREEKGMSTRTLAELSGVSYQTICDYELGKTNRPHPDVVKKVSEILEVSPYELLGTSIFNLGSIKPKTQDDVNVLREMLNEIEKGL